MNHDALFSAHRHRTLSAMLEEEGFEPDLRAVLRDEPAITEDDARVIGEMLSDIEALLLSRLKQRAGEG